MTDYIDVKNRHLCDFSKEYCVLNLNLDGIPYSGYVMFYHRTQKNVKQFELKDQGEAIQQELAQEGWKIVHRHMVRGGIYQVIYYERPKGWTMTHSQKPRIVGPLDKANMQDGMEYACLYFNRGSDESFRIEFYDKNTHRKTDLMRGISHGDVLAQMKKQGWQQTYGTGDGEGVTNYFQRPFSPINDSNWIPIIPESASAPTVTPPTTPSPVIDRRQDYLPRPKWTKERTGELEDGVEYMEIVFYRNFQGEGLPTEIITYGKGRQRSSQKKYMDIHAHTNYLKDLEKDGWYEVHSTGNSEGSLTYLERQRLVPLSESRPEASATDTRQYHVVMIGGEQRTLQTEANSLFTEIVENGVSKRQMGNINTILEQAIADGWIHLGTHTGNTKTAYILGRNGQVMSSEHITPDQHTQLPAKIRITRIEDLGGELTVSAYDNQKVDTLRNQKKSLTEFVATMTKNGDWQLAYEAQESGHRVIYLGRIMP